MTPLDLPPFDFSHARFNMIEQQIRTWDVLDQEILDLLDVVHREDFVPPAQRRLAFVDMEIPLGEAGGPGAGDAAMWQPKLEARVLQELAVKAHDSALEIGAGSGYFAALLAHRCRQVTSVEIVPGLRALAERNVRAAGINNVRVVEGDGARGHGRELYDVIVLSGSVPVLPQGLLAQLRPGGRMFAVVGNAPVMAARLLTRDADGSVASSTLFETVLTPLRNAEQPPHFRF